MPKIVEGEGYRDFAEPRFFEAAEVADIAKIRNPVDKAHAILAGAGFLDVWKFDGSSSATADAYNVIDPLNTQVAGRWLHAFSASSIGVNVLAFGADPTGTSDSTTAFANAIAALKLGVSPNNDGQQKTGTIYIPPGEYLVSDLGLPDGVILQGAGRDAVLLRNTSQTADLLKLTTVAHPLVVQHSIAVRDLSLKGHVTATAGSLINLDGGSDQQSSQCIISNVVLNNGYNGLRMVNTIWVTCIDVRANSCVNDGFTQSGTMNSASFISCSAYGCGRHGFYLRPNYTTLMGCASEFNTQDGFHLYRTAPSSNPIASFISCGAENNTGNGFYADTPNASSWVSCYSTGSGESGFKILGAVGCKVIACRSDSAGDYGFETGNGSGGGSAFNNELSGFTFSGTTTNASLGGLSISSLGGWTTPAGIPGYARNAYLDYIPVRARGSASLAAGGQITATFPVYDVAGSGGAVTSSAAPFFAGSYLNGAVVMLQGTSDTNTLTLSDNTIVAGCLLKLTTNTIVLGAGDNVTLQYNSVRTMWEEIGRAVHV